MKQPQPISSQKAVETSVAAALRGLSVIPGAENYMRRVARDLQKPVTSPAQKLMGHRGVRRGVTDRVASSIIAQQPGVEPALVDEALAGGIDHPHVLERLATRRHRAGDAETAYELRVRAAELDPQTAHRHAAVGLTLLDLTESALERDSVLGLTPGLKPRTAEAVRCFERALELEPGNAYLLYQLGLLCLKNGEQERGLQHLELAVLKNPEQEWLLQLAAEYRKPQVAQFERAMATYERAFIKDTKDPKALNGLINMGIRGSLDWARVWQNARRLEERKSTPGHVETLLSALDELFGADAAEAEAEQALLALEGAKAYGAELHPTTMSLLSSRLQSLGFMFKGYEVRRDAARRTISRIGATASEKAENLRRLVAALVYLDDYEVAEAVLSPAFGVRPQNELERQRLQKLRADVALLRGDAQPYLDYCRDVQRRQPLHADDAVRQLVEGKRIALVGPADTGDELGEEIDGYDVIVRTRFQKDFIEQNSHRQGSRTDLAYYNGRDVAEMREEIQQYVDDGDLKLVVCRPLSFESLSGIDAEWLRFYRHDFSLYHHGMALALPRIAYDLMQFDPAEICLFNTDMYTGESAFAAGYRQERKGFQPGSVLNDLIISHDLPTDFKVFKALQSAGVLTAQGVTAQVLDLSVEEYIAKLETSGALG